MIKAVRGLWDQITTSAWRGSNKLRYGGSTWEKSWGRAVGGDALRIAGNATRGVSRMGNAGMMATTGAIGGGMYGAVSNDTSVLGGALMGAGIGAGGATAAVLGKRGMRGYGISRARGLGVGRSAAVAGAAMGKMSSRFIGSQYNKAYNRVASTLSK